MNQLYRLTYDPLTIVGLCILGAIIIVAVFAPHLTPYASQVGPYTNFSSEFLPPSATHLFGTDNVGKDVFTQVIFGFRISLFVATVVLIASVPIGIVLGLIAGYYGGWMESVIQRVTEIFLALPALIFALVIAAILGPSLQDVIIALISLWWNWYARLMYTVTKSLKTQPYIQSAKAQGAGSLRIMFREILPNATSTLTAKMMIDLGVIILIESAMGFLGIGAQPPTPDLGVMVAEGLPYLATYWWISIFPSLALTLLVLSFNLIGIGIRDLFDVKVI
ncbi:MAG: ABC transporter permease [Nitrososphaerota archaeon]|nr:ABC transporter permease [Nitrososphaerota archaeon]